MMELPKDFYTVSTFFTFSGTTTAVWIIGSSIGYLMDRQDSLRFKKWVSFILSLVFALLGVTLQQDHSPLIWFIAVVNGFVVYLAAVGANTVMSSAIASSEPPRQPTLELEQPLAINDGGIKYGRNYGKTPITNLTNYRARGKFDDPWW
jgi:predicted neutral ceramidase superfamily lipid hydrolase